MEETALITGASSGIGFELCRLFARDHYRVALVARDAERLARAAQTLRTEYATDTIEIAIDLADPDAPDSIYERLKQMSVTVDVLVNCAGLGHGGPFHKNRLDQETDVLQVNLLSAVRLVRLFAPDFVRRGRGKILNVSSLAAFIPGPFLANYFATKSYMLSFSEALAVELRPHNITVTALCPGTTRTGFHRKAGIEATNLAAGGPLGSVMTPEAVAKIGYKALMNGKTVVIAGLINYLTALSVRLAPRNLVAQITASINRIPA
jgi:uncharacterized protein